MTLMSSDMTLPIPHCLPCYPFSRILRVRSLATYIPFSVRARTRHSPVPVSLPATQPASNTTEWLLPVKSVDICLPAATAMHIPPCGSAAQPAATHTSHTHTQMCPVPSGLSARGSKPLRRHAGCTSSLHLPRSLCYLWSRHFVGRPGAAAQRRPV